MEDYLQASSSLDSNVKSNIIKHLKNISDETKKSITANPNEGIFYQRYFNVYYDSYDNAYRIQSNCVTTKCDLTYFKNDAFRDYIKSKIRMVRCNSGCNRIKINTFAQIVLAWSNI